MRKAVSVLLALIMVFTMAPITVFAEDDADTQPLYWLDNGQYKNGMEDIIETRVNNGGKRMYLYYKNGADYTAIDPENFDNDTITKNGNIGFFGWVDDCSDELFWNTENLSEATEGSVVFSVGDIRYCIKLKVTAPSVEEVAAEFVNSYLKNNNGNIFAIDDLNDAACNQIIDHISDWDDLTSEQQAAVNALLETGADFDAMASAAVRKQFNGTAFISAFTTVNSSITADNILVFINGMKVFRYMSSQEQAVVNEAVNTSFASLGTTGKTIGYEDIGIAAEFIFNYLCRGGDNNRYFITRLDNNSTGDEIFMVKKGASDWSALTEIQKTAVNKALAQTDSTAQTYETMLQYAQSFESGSDENNESLKGIPFDTSAVVDLDVDAVIAILKDDSGDFNFTKSNPHLDSLQKMWAFCKGMTGQENIFKELETRYGTANYGTAGDPLTVAQGFYRIYNTAWFIHGYLSNVDDAEYIWEARVDVLDKKPLKIGYAFDVAQTKYAHDTMLTKEQQALLATYMETSMADGYAKAITAIQSAKDDDVVNGFKLKYLWDYNDQELITPDNIHEIESVDEGNGNYSGAINPWNVMGGEAVFRNVLTSAQRAAVDAICQEAGDCDYYELLRLAQAHWIAHLDKNISLANALAIVKSPEIGSALVTAMNDALLYGKPLQLTISAEISKAMAELDKNALNAAMPSGYTVENYQDIGVSITVEDKTTNISQTDGNVSVIVGQAKEGKQYKMIRKHGDEVDVLPITTDQDGNLIVESSKFSSYALMSMDISDCGNTSTTASASAVNADYKEETSFWRDVESSIQAAQNGENVTVEMGTKNKLAWFVIDALCQNPDVGLILTQNGKTVVRIPAGKAIANEAGRTYYSIAELQELYSQYIDSADATSNAPVTATATAVQQAEPEKVETLPDAAADPAPVEEKTEQEPMQEASSVDVPETQEEPRDSIGGVAIGAAAAIVAVIAAAAASFFAKKKQQ